MPERPDRSPCTPNQIHTNSIEVIKPPQIGIGFTLGFRPPWTPSASIAWHSENWKSQLANKKELIGQQSVACRAGGKSGSGRGGKIKPVTPSVDIPGVQPRRYIPDLLRYLDAAERQLFALQSLLHYNQTYSCKEAIFLTSRSRPRWPIFADW